MKMIWLVTLHFSARYRQKREKTRFLALQRIFVLDVVADQAIRGGGNVQWMSADV